MAVARAGSGRSYAGKSAEERRTERTAALIDAARGLWCEQGWAGVTMRAVCARAGLTDRYFYENFADRDAVLVAVAERERDRALALLLRATSPHPRDAPFAQLRAALVAIVGLIDEDPGSAHILFGDHGGSAVLERYRRSTIQVVVDVFVEIARPCLLPTARETEFRVNVLLGIGGFVETVTAWRAGLVDVAGDELVEMLQGAGESIGRRFLVGDPG